MAIIVEMADDIRKFETKSVGPFTTRQLIWGLAGIGIALPIGLLLPFKLEDKILVSLVLAVPAFIMGFIKMDGMKGEVLVIRYLYKKVLAPQRRKYISKNTFREDLERQEKIREKKKLSKMTASEKKKYEKEKQSKEKIVYSSKKENKVYM